MDTPGILPDTNNNKKNNIEEKKTGKALYPTINADNIEYEFLAAIQSNRPHDAVAIYRLFPHGIYKYLANGLRIAVHLGYADDIRILHQCFPDYFDPNIGFHDAEANTLLHIAAERQYPDCILALCQCFPRIVITIQNSYHETALDIAAENGSVACIEALYQCFPVECTTSTLIGSALIKSVNSFKPDPIIALHKYFNQSIQSQYVITAFSRVETLQCAAALYTCFPDSIISSDPDAEWFCTACQGDVVKMTTILQQRRLSNPDFDINMKDIHSYTALMYAAAQGHAEFITALYHNATYSHDNDLLVVPVCHPPSADDGNDPDADAAADNDATADNDNDDLVSIALLHAAENGHADCIEVLHALYPNINVNIRDDTGRSPLLLASRGGFATCIETLCRLFSNIDYNLSDNAAHTALQHATENGHADCIRIIHKSFTATKIAAAAAAAAAAKINTNTNDNFILPELPAVLQLPPELNLYYLGSSILHLAAMHGHAQCIQAIYECFPQIDPNSVDSRQRNSPLLWAVLHNHPTCIQTLYQCYPTLNTMLKGKDGKIALLLAISLGNAACIPALCAMTPSNQDVFQHALQYTLHQDPAACIPALHDYYGESLAYNAKSAPHGESLLHQAVSTRALPLLLQYFPHIDPNIQDIHGETALIKAWKYNNLDAIMALFHTFPQTLCVQDESLLWLQCAILGDVEELRSEQMWSRPKFDPNVTFSTSSTSALMYAARQGHDEYIQALCEKFPHRIDPNMRDRQGNTALILATKNNHASTIKTLRHCFPQIDADKTDLVIEYTPLMVAAVNSQVDCIYAIQRSFPKQDPHDALLLAAQHGAARSIIALIQSFPDLDINITQQDGQTALSLAAQGGHVNCIIALGEYAADDIDVNYPDDYGDTPLLYAVTHGKNDCIVALYDYFSNIDPEMRNANELTALTSAINFNDDAQRYYVDIRSIITLCKCFPELLFSQENDGSTVFMRIIHAVNNYEVDPLAYYTNDDDDNFALEQFLLFLQNDTLFDDEEEEDDYDTAVYDDYYEEDDDVAVYDDDYEEDNDAVVDDDYDTAVADDNECVEAHRVE